MSGNMQSVVHALGSMLHNLLQGEEHTRRPAELELSRYVTQATFQTFHGLALIAQGAGAYPSESRTLSLLLLRRQPFLSITPVNPNDPPEYFPFDALTDEQVDVVFGCLLRCLEDEMDVRIRRGLAGCVGKWMEEWESRGRQVHQLLPVLLRLATSPTPSHRLTVYLLISTHPTIPFHLSFNTSSSPSSTNLKAADVAQLLSKGMEDDWVDVRVEAVKAAKEVLEGEEVGDDGREEVGGDLIGKACQVLTTLPSEKFSLVSFPLTSILSTYPNLFETHLIELYKYLLALTLPPSGVTRDLPLFLQPPAFTGQIDLPPVPPVLLTDGTTDEQGEMERYAAALEFLLTLVETADFDPLRNILGMDNGAMVRMLLGRMVGVLRVQGEEEEETLKGWLEADDLDEINGDYPSDPEDALKRLFDAIPQTFRRKDKASSLVLEPIRQLLKVEEWKGRHTGLMALSAVISSVIEDESEKEVAARETLQLIEPSLSHPHPRVRYGAIYFIGQLALAFEDDDFAKGIADASLQAISLGLNAPEPRIQCQAALSLVNLMEVTTSDLDGQHVNGLVTRLVDLIQHGPKSVQEECTTALGYVALTAERHFVPFASNVMAMLLQILQRASGDEYLLLRCRAFEASGIVAMAVGKAAVAEHLEPLAKELIQAQATKKPDDDFQASYIAQTWSKLARVLKSDFQPYISYVLPTLLKQAAARPTIQPLDSDSTEEEISLPAGMQVVSFDMSSRIAIDSKAMEEKALAFEALPEYLENLSAETLAPYLDESLVACLETVDFIWEPTARVNAINSLPKLLEHAKTLNQPEKITPIFTALNLAILRETDTTYLTSLYQSFAECLIVMNSPLPPDVRKQFENATEFQLSGFEEIRKLRCSVPQYSLSERREEYEIQREEDDALQAIVESLKRIDPKHTLFGQLGIARSFKISKHARNEQE